MKEMKNQMACFLLDRGVCGFNATASNISALLYSPGWPNPYSPGLNCTWILSAPEGSQVNITFQQFDTEFCCDYLLVSSKILL